jgi:hypothetical protein
MIRPASIQQDRRSHHQRRSPYPARSLHLVDIENLAGTGRPEPGQVGELYCLYRLRVGLATMDQVVVALSEFTVRNVGGCWPGARYLVRSGPNGAALELLAVIEQEHVTERFANVIIASGDGTFTAAAASLAAVGCAVMVISRRGALSNQLALTAAPHIVYLDPPRNERSLSCQTS